MLLRGVRTHLVLVAVIGQYIRVFQVILVLDEGSWRAAESGTGRKERLRCGGDPRIEGVLKRGGGVAPCVSVRRSE